MRPDNCSPSVEINASICFSRESLIKIATEWNKLNNDKIIVYFKKLLIQI